MTRPIRMPFGKWKGRLLTELPADYLKWLGDLSGLREPLRGAVWIEIRDRRAAGKWPAVARRAAAAPRPAPRPEREPARRVAESRPAPVSQRPEPRPAPATRPAPDGIARAIEAESATDRRPAAATVEAGGMGRTLRGLPAAESAATADEWADLMSAAGKAVGRA